jgi:2-hydroxychromene-2-carboxylate isomerase
MNAIDFYFDFSSPYGYLASTQIDQLAAKHDRKVKWRPYLVGTAMKATGHQPLFNTPLLHDYVVIDVPRFARLLGVPFQLPESFPLVASAASRAFYWLERRGGSEPAGQFARNTYHTFFVEGRDISKTDELRTIAETVGVDGEELIRAIQDPETKSLFKEKNDAALARGVFGSPYMIVEGQPFWGADRLYQLDQWLETGGW